ncbi:MAG: alginate export family protein [Candidatus Omnitrophica bacterium]|nr:alginate export family protein [Candidatus Omnitrophota bacterium]
MPIACYAEPILETKGYVLSMDTYLRKDLVSFKNVVDLDSANSDDTTTYLGIDYSLGFDLQFKDGGPQYYLKLERNGPFDYDAPLSVHNTLMTYGGVIDAYRQDELLPQLEEFWFDLPLFDACRFKLGLYIYEVGNGFSLNGGFENFGFTLYEQEDNFSWRLYYCRPDIHNKNQLGPRIQQEAEQGIDYEHSPVNFFAADATIEKGKNTFQPYIGALIYYTSPGKRSNFFTAPIKEDILGTIGFAWDWEDENFALSFEAARNFGKAKSSSSDYEDIYHSGYLIYTEIDYRREKLNPSLKLVVASGNKVPLDSALNQDETLSSSRNRGFSYYSPFNDNIGDSISCSNADMLPIVAMGGGYGLNYGVPRPTTLAVADYENIIIPSLGFDYQATEKLSVGLYWYYLRNFEEGAGVLNGQAKRLSAELGNEVDLFIDYELTPNILISFLGGYFIPGEYYKEARDDTDGSLFSPYLRGDQKADNAYQIELAIELQF